MFKKTTNASTQRTTILRERIKAYEGKLEGKREGEAGCFG